MRYTIHYLTPALTLSLVFLSTAAWAQPPGWGPQPMLPPAGPIAPGGLMPPGGMMPPGPGIPPAGVVPPAAGFGAFEQPVPLQNYSWLYVAAPQPREIKVHDIVTIIVKEQSQTTVDSRFTRNRMATMRALINEFIRLDNNLNLAPAAQDRPGIDSTLTGRLITQGTAIEREGMVYRIAATVVDVLPNGNLVLEARKTLQSNDDVWEYSLTGQIRSTDINRDNTALSENVADLQIRKQMTGKVRKSTGLPWGTKLYDVFFPF